MRITLILSLILAVVAVLFALQNPDPMEVRFGLFGPLEGSTALILIVTFTLGVLVGVLAALPGRFRSRKEIKTLRKRLADQPAATPPPMSQDPAAVPYDEPPPAA